MTLSEELQARGFVHQYIGENLAEVVDGDKRVVYHGIDPTADSAHAGNFVSWLLLKHLANHGHKIIFLVGGGTGMIGDPKPDVERTLLTKEQVAQNVAGLKKQAEKIFKDADVQFVNNADWLSGLQLIEFLRDIGKHFTVNELIKKEAIQSRLNREDGISYTEFAYPLLQGYDYLQLNRLYGCDLQISGSDQWGNILTGVELIRRKEQKRVFALTSPMIVDKTTGKKFGKSEGNAVWLDAEKTSPYQFYQFWLNVADENVIAYLKLFTFVLLDEVAQIEVQHGEDPGARIAQKRLAFEVTALVHGEDNTQSVIKVSEFLFGGGDIKDFIDSELVIITDNAPRTFVQENQSVIEVLVASDLATSKREAREFIENGAVSLNGIKITDVNAELDMEQFNKGVSLLKRGKKQYSVLQITKI